jgi:hypothetical protein
MGIILSVIDGYSIGGYSCLLMVIILVATRGYYIGVYFVIGHSCLLMVIILVAIGGYSIGEY